MEDKYLLSFGGDIPVAMYLTQDEVIEKLRKVELYLDDKKIKSLRKFLTSLHKGEQHEFTSYPEPFTLIDLGPSSESKFSLI